jgi:hypothetical protein
VLFLEGDNKRRAVPSAPRIPKIEKQITVMFLALQGSTRNTVQINFKYKTEHWFYSEFCRPFLRGGGKFALCRGWGAAWLRGLLPLLRCEAVLPIAAAALEVGARYVFVGMILTRCFRLLKL